MFVYEIKSPTLSELISFLYVTKDDFIPSLDIRVNIEEYANKLYRNADFVVCRCDNKVVGLVCYYQNRPPIGYISHVGVLKSYRRMGIMREMFFLLHKNATIRSIKELGLEVSCSNTPAINAYTKLGFRISRNTDESIYMKREL